MIGTALSHYKIISKLGAGGMGEVYRARDSKLNREVAIKVLPEGFAEDAERVVRFQREAQVLASLNHPNIAAIYGLEESDGVRALVMELVEGPTLADRIAAGPIPIDEALPIARQIAEAFEAAHERGIVHRDLKPANVKVTRDGAVKVLDFGLAKVLTDDSDAADLSHSPTLIKGTQAGMILGTAAYMSPEQAKGRTVDRRADIWAFGCVLWEMLSGEKTFNGETLTDTLAAVIKEDPVWEALPADLSPVITRLLRRCLEKDPKRRLPHIGSARLDLDEVLDQANHKEGSGAVNASQAALKPAAGWFRFLPWVIAVGALVTAVALLAQRKGGNSATSTAVRHFALALPAEGKLILQSAPSLVFSPDGTHLVATIGEARNWQLLDRTLSAVTARPIDGTQGAESPFFSPDGQWVAFFVGGALKKVSLSGGAPERICAAPNARGGVWALDDTIIFSPGTDSPLSRVRAGGGSVEVISSLDASARERSHRWPDVLPGGKAILFTIAYEVGNPLDDASMAVLDLATGKHKIILKGAAFARYVPAGHIVYARRGAIVAVPFDGKRLEVTGAPITVQENVVMSSTYGGAQFSFSRSGDFAYVAGPPDEGREVRQPLVWVDRRGSEQVLNGELHRYSTPRLTPDGRTLVLEVGDPSAAIWAYSLDRGTLSRVTMAGVSYDPIPAPDGEHVAYEAVRDGTAGVLMSRLDGSGEERLTSSKRLQVPTSWTPDGKVLAITAASDSGYLEILLIVIDGDRTPRTFIQESFNVGGARFSPDGRWIAYVSDESGRDEVYVRPYPEAGSRVQISAGGGSQPAWSRNGRELFFRNGDEMLVADVTLSPTFKIAKPRVLFARFNSESTSGLAYDMIAHYDVSPDGQRFVMVKPAPDASAVPDAHVVLNWFARIEATLVSAGK